MIFQATHIFKVLALVILFQFCTVKPLFSQEKNYRIGFYYGEADQANFLFNNTDYLYETRMVKLTVNRPFKQLGKFRFEFDVGLAYYAATQQLLNLFFVTPDEDNFMELRELFTQERSSNEYALHLGLIIRYTIKDALSVYFLGSVGPMYTDIETERLARGFAFSDIASLGIVYDWGKWGIDLRLTARHNSNAGLQLPNSGVNSLGWETGVFARLF